MNLVTPLIEAWDLSLRARNRAPKTVENYLGVVHAFTKWCEAEDIPTDPARQRGRDVEAWLAKQLANGAAPSSVALRFRALQQWYRWLLREEEIETDPMVRLRAPTVDDPRVEVITDEQMKRLLDACKGNSWLARRDAAIVRFLADTGCRVGELVSMTTAETDLGAGVALLHGKTGTRLAPFGARTAEALSRYVRSRARRPQAALPTLWLGVRGAIGTEAVRMMIAKRAKEAGIGHIHPHQFRHTAAHNWLAAGGQEQDLARNAGWVPGSTMIARYGASAAQERARQAHRRFGLGDRF